MTRTLNLLLTCWVLWAWVPMQALAQPQAQLATVSVPIDRTLVQLPVPAGFADPTRVLPQMRQLGERMTPATNRLLAIFMAQTDIDSSLAGQQPAMSRYFMAQTLRQTETSQISEGEFGQVKTMLRQQYQSLLKQIGPKVQGELDRAAREIGQDAGQESLSLKTGELKGLEVFDERAGSISLLAATQYQVQVGDRVNEVPMAMGITTAVIKGKLVYFYAYSVYRGAADLEWVRSVTRDWLPLAVSSNQP